MHWKFGELAVWTFPLPMSPGESGRRRVVGDGCQNVVVDRSREEMLDRLRGSPTKDRLINGVATSPHRDL
jgi:hypothetical protein